MTAEADSGTSSTAEYSAQSVSPLTHAGDMLYRATTSPLALSARNSMCAPGSASRVRMCRVTRTRFPLYDVAARYWQIDAPAGAGLAARDRIRTLQSPFE